MLAPIESTPFGQTLAEVLRFHPGFVENRGVRLTLEAIARGGLTLSKRLRYASLEGALGRAHKRNVFGDDVQKLDAAANTLFCSELSRSRACIAIASEELKTPIVHEGRHCKCSVMLDPLDGSSNLDAGLSVGSIFGIFADVKWPSRQHAFLRPGRGLSAAGYVLYGPRTTLVIASGGQVMGFDLDDAGEYRLTLPDIRCPAQGAQYSVNEANQASWDDATRAYFDVRRRRSADGAPAKLRYSGALVCDAHRTLISGGIFAYPGSLERPRGKLRQLYEVNPIAFVFETAGGASSTGRANPLDECPKSLAERSPLVVGSPAEVQAYEAALA